MAYTTATLTGTYLKTDGTPAEGTVEIIPNSSHLVDAEGDVILSGRVKVALDATGSFSVTLPATDDTTVEPATGRQYTIVAKLRHTHLAAITGVELAGGSTVDVADVASQPVVDPAVTLAATTAQLTALEESLTADLAGKQPAGDYATTTDLATKADVTALDAKVDTVEADAMVAGFANDPASETSAALSATFAPKAGATIGARLRRAARAARDYNALDRGVMATPPTITTGTTTLDATLTLTYYFTTGSDDLYAYRGGTPVVYSSIYYRFPVVTVASGGNVAATQQANGWAVEFMCDAPKVMLFMANSTSANGLQVEVDGQPVAATRTAFPATSGGSYVLLDFTTAGGAKVRRFRVEADQASGMRGVHVAPTYTVWKPTDAEDITVASVGDSVTAQTGVTLPNGGFAAGLGKLLGWADVRQIALGGTGWTTPGAWGAGSEFGGARRVADAQALAPDAVVLTGSTNDSAASAATITAAVTAGLQAYRAALPDAPIVLFGVWPGSTGPSAAVTANENAVKAGFNAFADGNSWFVPISTDAVGSWVTGTGKVGATTGTGNADRYVSSDGIHPGQTGHDYYARRAAAAVRDLVLPNV